jgi:phosphatidylserine decarboxylase
MLATKMMGRAARIRLPRPVSRAAVGAYARYFDVELGDVEPDLLARGFSSFDDFFTRPLRTGVRSVANDPNVLVAPCDGYLREVVEVERGRQVVAKGHAYSVGELLADEELAEGLVGGVQAVIYLHPRDYHRVHTPCGGVVCQVSAIPGRLLPVTDASVDREPRLFSLNERLVHVVQTEFGKVVVVMVAAFGVGHMSCSYGDIEAHPSEIVRMRLAGAAATRVEKGDELGIFHLGSTVVLYAPAGVRAIEGLEPGPLSFGTPLLELSGRSATR